MSGTAVRDGSETRKDRFAAIAPVSLKDLVSGAIREAILNGKLSPGERVIELKLAKQLKVGQNAVREALQELEFQGFVTKAPNRGTFVTDLSLDDINQIYRFRKEFEGFAAQLAREAGRPNAQDISELEQALRGMQEGADTSDFLKFSKSDLEFHEIIWHASGNQYVEKALRAVAIPQFSYFLVRSFRHTYLNLHAITQQHREIMESLRSGEPLACRECLSRITEDFWRQIVGSIDEREK
jgi:DNA-binding GntR family transcriptional regulator